MSENSGRVEPADVSMRLFDAIYGLRATRRYQDRPIEPGDLDQVLQAATMASSSGNTQPWDFVVVRDAELRKRLKVEMTDAFATIDTKRAQSKEDLTDKSGRPVTGHAAVENIDRVPAIVVVCWNPDRGIRMKGEYEELADGSMRETKPFPGGRGSSLFQACQNMMLAANGLGISSLFTTFFGLKEQEIKQILEIPPRVFMEAAVFLGYGDEKLGNPRRKPLAEVAHADRYGTPYEITS